MDYLLTAFVDRLGFLLMMDFCLPCCLVGSCDPLNFSSLDCVENSAVWLAALLFRWFLHCLYTGHTNKNLVYRKLQTLFTVLIRLCFSP